MRAIALALAVMVPAASFAHGIGPSDDAPVVQRTPSARLLPTANAEPAVTPDPPRPFYARSWFWTVMGAATVTLAVAFALVGILWPRPVAIPVGAGGCPGGVVCGAGQ
jgi:hypothetical protein